MDWSLVKKEHIEQAIKKFIDERAEYPETKSYYLKYEGVELPYLNVGFEIIDENEQEYIMVCQLN